MVQYITAKGVALAVSAATNGWPANSTAKESQVGTALNDAFHGKGGDTLTGGLGDDTYYLWDSTEIVVEQAGQGVDTIDSRFWGPVTLAANVENLLLNSPGSTAGTGNALNNIIIAGSVGATLNGLAGDDVLVGGAGADLFKVSAGNGSDAIMNFKPGSDVIQLTGYGITSFSQLQALATPSGADIRFTFANGESLMIRDVALSSLSAYDFGLKPTPAALLPGYSQLTGAGKAWTANGWYVLNNVWNPGTLVEGKDYSVDSTYSAADMTSKTTFNWSFPVVTEAAHTIRAYPEVIFGPAPMSGGHKASDISVALPVQVGTLNKLVADYDVSYKGNTSGFNVSFDIWLTNVPNGGASTVTTELMVWVHKGDFDAFGQVVGTYSNGSVTGKIYVSNGDWKYIAVVLDQDTPKGQIDIFGILQKLQELNLVSSKEYVASVELGSEVISGAGSLTINNLDLSLQTRGEDGSLTTTTVTGSGTSSSIQQAAKPVADVSGNDVVSYDSAASTLQGGAGHDTLILNIGATVNLADTVNQVAGAPIVTGFEDVDASGAVAAVVLKGSADANTLIGGAFADVLTGGDGADVLRGGDGNDSLDGGAGVDQLQGGAGDDRIVYDAADSVVDGGAGRDLLVLKVGATVNLAGTATQVVGAGAPVVGFESVDASGAAGAVILNGTADANTLTGGAFADTLSGGAGNDVLDGGAGADRIKGEAGEDRIVYDASDVAIDGGSGRDTLVLKVGATVNLATFNSNQVTSGGAYVSGFEDTDASAATGAVAITGSEFANTLVGSAFADTLAGGAGFDALTGGAGADRFVFGAYAAGDVDKITDFSSAQGDRIDLSAVDAVTGGLDNAFTFIGQTAFHRIAGELRYSVTTGGVTVQADVNGDGVADFSIVVASSSLWISDFVL